MFVRLEQTPMWLFMLLPVISSVAVETIYNELISGKRSILAIGKLTHSSHVVLLAGLLTKPNDIYVFQVQAPETITDTLQLSGGLLLQTKWPGLDVDKLANASSVFLVSDFVYDYLVMFTRDGKTFAYNINQEIVDEIKLEKVAMLSMISSAKQLTSYTFKNPVKALSRCHFILTGSASASQVYLPNKTQMYPIEMFRICASIYFVTVIPFDEHFNCSDESTFVNWTIKTGFVDDHQMTLFDQDGTVYIFPKTSLEDGLTIPVQLVKTKLRDYFVLFNIAPPTSNVSIFPANSQTGFIIVIAISVILNILALIYFINHLCTSNKEIKVSKANIRASPRALPRDGSGKVSEKNAKGPNDQTSVSTGQLGKQGQKAKQDCRPRRRTPGPRGSRSRPSGNAPTGRSARRSPAPSSNFSQANVAMSAKSQPPNKSSSSAPKNNDHQTVRRTRRTSRNSTRSPKKSFRGGKSSKKLKQLGLDQYKGVSLE